MDQLFLMQRYWGSDEEDAKEKNSSENTSPEKSVILIEKRKSDIPVIHLDSSYTDSSKKRKLDSCFNTKNSKTDKKGADFSDNDSDIAIVNDSNNSDFLKCFINNQHFSSDDDTSNLSVELNKKAGNRRKSKDAKHRKKSEKAVSVGNEISNVLMNNDYSAKNEIEVTNDNKNNFKKEKKKMQRYFDSVQNNEECDELNKRKNDSIQEVVTVNNKIKTKNKKIKLKKGEINNSDEDTVKQYHNNEFDSSKGFRYFNSVDIRDVEDNQSSKNPESAITSDNEISGNPINIDNEKQSKKLKKAKLKSEKVDESSVDIKVECKTNSLELENGEAFPTIGQTYQQKNQVVKHTLPEWLSNPTYISVNLQEKETPISELNYLDNNTKNNLINAGITFLFPVQLAVIPWLLQSKEQSLLIRPSDICVSAPTGSGKTLAFVLPIVQSLKERVVCAIRALVVLPVSELAIQVYKVFQTYVQGTDLKVALITGKKSFIDEQNFLVKSTGHTVQSLVDIVVATPGRVHDHIYRTKGFCLKRLRYLVIDEADRMMEEIQQGWLKQVEDAVFHDCSSPNCVCSSYKRTFSEPTSAYNFGFISQPLQKLLYSATLTHDPEQLHTLSLYKPKLFTASSVYSKNEYKGSCAIPPGIKMYQVICEEGVKPMVICHLIKYHNFKRVLCFTETVERAHRLHIVLEEMKILKVREISSFNKPTQRKIVLHQFSSGKIDILVCSDLVARGIDIQDIDCVISYDIPENDKIYTHRVGRTARAGKTGVAMTLLSEGEIPHFKRLLSANPEIKLPERIDISSKDLKPFIKAFKTALSTADAKLKKGKIQVPGKSLKKVKRK